MWQLAYQTESSGGVSGACCIDLKFLSAGRTSSSQMSSTSAKVSGARVGCSRSYSAKSSSAVCTEAGYDVGVHAFARAAVGIVGVVAHGKMRPGGSGRRDAGEVHAVGCYCPQQRRFAASGVSANALIVLETRLFRAHAHRHMAVQPGRNVPLHDLQRIPGCLGCGDRRGPKK